MKNKTTKSEGLDGSERESHPAFGMAQFNRGGGSRRRLFGSAVRCDEVMRLTISVGMVEFSLHEHRYYGGETLIEVEMSAAQFAELITRHNINSGTPCTITFLKDQGRIADIPEEHKTEPEKITDEFKGKAKELGRQMEDLLKDAKEKLSKPMTAADRKAVLWSIEKFAQDVSANLPFLMDQLKESAAKVVHEAKKEVEAFVDSAVREHGLLGLRSKAPQIAMTSSEEEGHKGPKA